MTQASERLASATRSRGVQAAAVLARALELARPHIPPAQWECLVLGEERIASDSPAAPIASITRRLLWREDGRLVETWTTQGQGSAPESTLRESPRTPLETVASWALPAILQRLAGHLDTGPQEPTLNRLPPPGTPSVGRACEAIVEGRSTDSPSSLQPLDYLLNDVAQALEDGARALEATCRTSSRI